MTVVHTPGRPHECRIGWQMVDGSFIDPCGDDPPGTVRQCPACARCWVAEPVPQGLGVTWRLEKPRERRRRVRAARRLAQLRAGLVPMLPPGFVPPSAALKPAASADPAQIRLAAPARDAGQPPWHGPIACMFLPPHRHE